MSATHEWATALYILIAALSKGGLTFSLMTTLTVATRKRGCQEARWSGSSAAEARIAPHSTRALQIKYFTPNWKTLDLQHIQKTCQVLVAKGKRP